MVNKKIQMKARNGNEWDNLFPLTLNENVFNSSGLSLNTQLESIENILEKKADKTFVDSEIERLNNEVVTNKSEVETNLNVLNSKVSKNHYYLDNANNLQQALLQAEGGVLFLKKQTYLINEIIKIPSNIRIEGNGAIFRRNNDDINSMFTNDSNGNIGEYDANENIEINNVKFDGMNSSKCSIISFAHVKNIKITNCIFYNLERMHMIEFNSSKNVLVENNEFIDYSLNGTGSEMIQIDLAIAPNVFPWFGPYDATPCENIKIINNLFKNGFRAIGTHSAGAGMFHSRITIEHNEFINMKEDTIRGLDWAYTKINHNHFVNVHRGIVLRVQETTLNNHVIDGNYMSGLPDDTNSRAILIFGKSNGDYAINGGSIIDNRIKRFGGHGIGINNSERWTIRGNDVTTTGRSGILLYGAIDVIVTENNCFNNGINPDLNDESFVVMNESKNIIINSNNTDIIRVADDSTVTSVMNNLVKDEMKLAGTNTYAVNNIVNKLHVPITE